MAGKMSAISSFQAQLGLPRTDVIKTRQNVRLLFAVYRQYKANLEDGVPLVLEHVPPGLDEYQDCMDPAHIRSGLGTGNKPPDEREMMMNRFMKNVREKVNGLRALQGEILMVKFMGTDELNDVEVLDELERRGYCMGEATYNRTKQSAMMKIAAAMKLTVFREE